MDSFMSHKAWEIYPAIIMALTDKSYENAEVIVENICSDKSYIYFSDNIYYNFVGNSYGDYMYVRAMSTQYHEELTNKSVSTTTNENTVQTNTDIQNAISSVNSAFNLKFEPTTEQLEEIQEFYDINNETGDFNNDTLLQFLIQKGWVDMGENNNNNSNSNNSTNSSSSSNNSSSTKENTNTSTSTENKIQPYINVLVYPLTYFSDEERERVCQNNESVKITIKYNGKTIKSSTYKYSNNKDGIVELNNLKVDTNEGKLTVEINDKVVPDSNGNKNVDVSIYELDNELKDNMFTFADTSNMMG